MTSKPGAILEGVELRFGIGASRVSDSRCLALDGKLVLPATENEAPFELVPVVLCDAAPAIDPRASLLAPEQKKVEIALSVPTGGAKMSGLRSGWR
ncbi:MAG: hypothetical protein OXE94_02950 [Aestuariivita sp.]|nr:hypothetical protein [Aestuariivita sp.]MCY4204040.1 hypothetical protein [Aestuariivita sp.]